MAGAYDDVGNKQQSKTMLAVVRQDELEDIVVGHEPDIFGPHGKLRPLPQS